MERTCSVPDCTGPTGVPGSARGLCKNHYMRQYRSGSVEGKRKPLADRLWSYVDRTDSSGCWPWTGYVHKGGYGMIRVAGKNLFAHRVAWQLAHPDEPALVYPRDIICHTCDNPLCCRPDHLFKGTNADNSSDMVAKNRQAHGIRQGRAKLTDAEVAEIRRRYIPGRTRQVDLAAEFGVSQSMISEILRGNFWKHV